MTRYAVLNLEWGEYEPVRYDHGAIPDDIGAYLYERFREKIVVEFPTPKTDNQWEFISQGWVGNIPITDNVFISIHPKVPLANVFRMWEYAYRLRSFKFLDGIVGCASLTEFYEQLASILAKRIMDRSRQGLYKAYIGRSDRLPYLSGRLDVRRMASMPWRADLHCSFEDHTADLEENQILCWTLLVIARCGLCSEQVRGKVLKAYRELLACAKPIPIASELCIGRIYNRLNEDYEPLHGLCRFFLEHRAPHHELGDRAMVPFLVNMARLYELFVAEWLRSALPDKFELKAQHSVFFGERGEYRFKIDLLIFDRQTGTPLMVLDTKYKVPESPSYQDIHEVRSYAEAMGCEQAVLVYPERLKRPMNEVIGNIRVRTLMFPPGFDLERAGSDFIVLLFAPYKLDTGN